MSQILNGFLGRPKPPIGPPDGRGMVLLAKIAAANSAVVDFTSQIDGRCAEYEVRVHDLVPQTDAQDFWLRTSGNNGVSFAAGASDYLWSNFRVTSASTSTAVGSTASAQLTLLVNITNTGGPLVCRVNLSNPFSRNIRKMFAWTGGYQQSAAGPNAAFGSGYYTTDTNPINALRFMMSSGNIVSGTFYLYGIKTES